MYGVFVSSGVLQKGKHQACLSADTLAVVVARALVERHLCEDDYPIYCTLGKSISQTFELLIGSASHRLNVDEEARCPTDPIGPGRG
jgi:hypothetical protein